MARQVDRSGRGDSDNTAVLLRDAFAAIDRIVPSRLAGRGHGAVRVAHGVVFQHLDDGGTTVSTLAQRAGMTKQAMATLVPLGRQAKTSRTWTRVSRTGALRRSWYMTSSVACW